MIDIFKYMTRYESRGNDIIKDYIQFSHLEAESIRDIVFKIWIYKEEELPLG